MKENLSKFEQIQEKFIHNKDFQITVVNRNSPLIIFTPHGGGIERGTSELVRAIAGEEFSFYLFEGIMSKACDSKKMRITSTKFDEPRGVKIISQHTTSLAIHGCKGRKKKIFIGGRDKVFQQKLLMELKSKNYPVEENAKYLGKNIKNICNRTKTNKGIQLEFTRGIRCKMFTNWETRKGRKETSEYFDTLVMDFQNIIKKIILEENLIKIDPGKFQTRLTSSD